LNHKKKLIKLIKIFKKLNCSVLILQIKKIEQNRFKPILIFKRNSIKKKSPLILTMLLFSHFNVHVIIHCQIFTWSLIVFSLDTFVTNVLLFYLIPASNASIIFNVGTYCYLHSFVHQIHQ